MWKKLLLTSFIIFGMLSFSHAASVDDYKDFGYTGGVQSYTVPADGVYKLEVWGAQGGKSGGYGGYSYGYKRLSAGNTIYVVVGGYGGKYGGYNGGGNSTTGGCSDCAGGGGGATHIATTNRGTLSSYNSYRSEVLIVAGGGGGTSESGIAGGTGGGTNGGDAKGGCSWSSSGYYTKGATQTEGGYDTEYGFNGSFGQGGNAEPNGAGKYYGGGGGGGWYGGGGGQLARGSCWERAGSGGSGYTGGVTSWNGSGPSMSNGQQSGNGKAKITIMSITVTLTCPSASNKTYNGSSQTGMSCPTGSTASGNCSAKNAGSYRCTCTAKSGYTFNGNCYRDWTIGKANPKVTAPTAKTLTYNKSAQNLINAGSTTGGTIQYKVNNGAYSTSIPVGTNAGTYTVYYKVVGNTNYNDVAEKSITVSIAKASATIPSLSDTDKTYNGNSQSPTVNNRDSDKVGQSGTASATDAGTHTITWNLLDSNNYNWSDGTTENKSATWTIARAKTATASASDKNYDGTEQTGVSGSYVTWTGTTKATDPSLYTATATPDSNHAWSDGTTTAKNLTWSILQNWNRYTIDCLTNSSGNPVQPTDNIISNEAYTIQKMNFDIKAQDAVAYTFCVGNNSSKSVVYYNGEQNSIYYWKNGTWTKK